MNAGRFNYNDVLLSLSQAAYERLAAATASSSGSGVSADPLGDAADGPRPRRVRLFLRAQCVVFRRCAAALSGLKCGFPKAHPHSPDACRACIVAAFCTAVCTRNLASALAMLCSALCSSVPPPPASLITLFCVLFPVAYPLVHFPQVRGVSAAAGSPVRPSGGPLDHGRRRVAPVGAVPNHRGARTQSSLPNALETNLSIESRRAER